ncbi:hypothetical protein [Cerasicoccus fimbriatus]|uniref:hypothetical protein n=1 Tax=Cerasicoccus fimbriatus TaxID=3014554 RepID=UPI0022B488E1|nr:hypothetical protein [Cerasicoccus sp. TK19100]
MTLPQLKKFLKTATKQDRWWVAVGENVLDETQTMSEIKALSEKYPDWEICMLHESQTDKDGEWILLTEEEVEGEHNPFRPAGPIETMLGEMSKLKADLADAHRIVDILREFTTFNDQYTARKEELEERERYLQESEDALMEKAQHLEELRVELEHKQEKAAARAR